MHDPLVVAFDIHMPIPRRSSLSTVGSTHRWGIRARRRTNPEHLGHRVYPWWRPAGYRVYLSGHEYHLRRLATVWHVEPDGRDSGEVCKHYRREQQPDGTWSTTVLNGWRWHIHHWRIQIPALQALRRRLLTRCAWCGGRSTKTNPVNISHQWDSPKTPWWRGDTHLFHQACSSVHTAHRTCTCEDPILDHDNYGTCARCNLFRAFGRTARTTKVHQLYKRCPAGQAPPTELVQQVRALVRGQP